MFIEFILGILKNCRYLRTISIVALILTLLITPFFRQIHSSIRTIATQGFLPPLATPKRYENIANTIAINTDKDDKISVFGNNVAIYLISDRNSSSMLIYQVPIAEAKKELFEIYKNDLTKNAPKMIIITRKYTANLIADFMDFIVKLGYKEIKKDIFMR